MTTFFGKPVDIQGSASTLMGDMARAFFGLASRIVPFVRTNVDRSKRSSASHGGHVQVNGSSSGSSDGDPDPESDPDRPRLTPRLTATRLVLTKEVLA